MNDFGFKLHLFFLKGPLFKTVICKDVVANFFARALLLCKFSNGEKTRYVRQLLCGMMISNSSHNLFKYNLMKIFVFYFPWTDYKYIARRKLIINLFTKKNHQSTVFFQVNNLPIVLSMSNRGFFYYYRFWKTKLYTNSWGFFFWVVHSDFIQLRRNKLPR